LKTIKLQRLQGSREYEAALARIEELMEEDPPLETDKGKELMDLSEIVDQYEEIHFPMSPPALVDVLVFYMDQNNLKPVDLVPSVGSQEQVDGILDGRTLIDKMLARNLESGLSLPEGSLGKFLS
jgi:HTH-type transcriptional regulator/antitoxin HigA